MALDTIGVGTANQGDGDTIRAAFVKVNDNFGKTVEKPASAPTTNRMVVFDGTGGQVKQAAFTEANVARLDAANTFAAAMTVNAAAVFNETSADVDFRVESDDNANMLFVDGGEDRVGIGTGTPTAILDVDGDTVRLRTARTPASASDTGAVGEICWDADYIYVCTATDTWKRVAIATWP
jgi:hypothetical protein